MYSKENIQTPHWQQSRSYAFRSQEMSSSNIQCCALQCMKLTNLDKRPIIQNINFVSFLHRFCLTCWVFPAFCLYLRKHRTSSSKSNTLFNYFRQFNFCFHVRFTASTKFSFGAIEFAYLALLRRLVPAGKAEVSVLLYCYIKSLLIYKEHHSKSVIFIGVAYSCTLSFFLLILYTMFYLEDQ